MSVQSRLRRVIRSFGFAVWLLSMGLAAAAGEASYWALPIPGQGQPPAGHVPPADRTDPGACGLCHLEIYRQWQSSRHAGAFSPGLAGRLGLAVDIDAGSCLRCHAPREEQWQDWARYAGSGASFRHGVDCASCHLRNHRRHGLRALQTAPHGDVVAVEDFGRSHFCSVCHQFTEAGAQVDGKPLENTYREWLDSDRATTGRTCQSCHMPDGRHEFRGIHDRAMTRAALAIAVRRTGRAVSVELRNRGAGHHLPTYGTPRITVLVQATGSGPARRLTHVVQRALDWDAEQGWRERFDTRLAAGTNRRLSMPLGPDQGARVEVAVEPDFDYTERVYPQLLDLPDSVLPAPARSQIEAALQRGRANRYILATHVCPPARLRVDCDEIPDP